MTTDFFYTIDKASHAVFKDRGSRFLAYAYPVSSVEEFKKHLQELKKEHSGAVHHCFAYRLGAGREQYRVSDDGEPAGSAGRPILGQLDSRNLTNTTVIVVRYFGGTLLGVPGLINAYKSASSLALQLTPVIRSPVMIPYRMQFDYTILNDVMRILKKYDCIVLKQDMQLFCMLETAIPRARLELSLLQLKELKGIEISVI